MPTKEQEQHIGHLFHYVRGLNRGRGMGFVMQRKRISYSFVLTTAVRAASAMLFLFPIMLSLSSVKKGGDELLNRTCAACALDCGLDFRVYVLLQVLHDIMSLAVTYDVVLYRFV